ncbi:hypothetical protein ER308_06140 [Egibacter rhizosphaerae]|uniref:Uncharacterized protein n=1 Tax=Egibacter rhizosphaerae TaxID=1670831 RepID=A0A411YD50_9ACTN|nr:hypothetical protein ER308_06140 [Egibacter rhizosphaerae]
MSEQLAVAAAQPPTRPEDPESNARAHAAAIARARARLVVFPELSLTGYDLEAAPVQPGDTSLRPVIEAGGRSGATALVGAPVTEGGRASIAMLRVEAHGAQVAYRKRWLGEEEAVRFDGGAKRNRAAGAHAIPTAVDQLRVWRHGDQRAHTSPCWCCSCWGVSSAANASLPSATSRTSCARLADFGPPRRHHHPEFPFWHLRNDGIWEVADAEPLRSSRPARPPALTPAPHAGRVPRGDPRAAHRGLLARPRGRRTTAGRAPPPPHFMRTSCPA